MLFHLNFFKQEAVMSDIKSSQDTQLSQKGKLSPSKNFRIVSNINSNNVYLPNVVNKTNLISEWDECQSEPLPKKTLTLRKSRAYWWM
ncbi:MAG: hypothetical protein NHB32_15615 [Fischerella sp. CENA71]|nr:hypothetical protein [Fischerella sp. CENA71]